MLGCARLVGNRRSATRIACRRWLSHRDNRTSRCEPGASLRPARAVARLTLSGAVLPAWPPAFVAGIRVTVTVRSGGGQTPPSNRG
jgi:hypothetical protein